MAEKKVEAPPDKVDQPSPDSPSATEVNPQAPNATRRGLIKAGVVAVPVVMTLKGQSAMAHVKGDHSKYSLNNSHPVLTQQNQNTEFKRG